MAVVQTLIGNVKGPAGATGATGATGDPGQAATITVGSTTTTAYGNAASVTNSGTSSAAVFDFVIPQGKPGEATTKMGDLLLDSITSSAADFPSPQVGDTGKTAFGKIVKFFSDTIAKFTQHESDMATISTSPTTQAFSKGEYLVYQGQLYRVTSNIANGGNLVVGNNITATSAGTQLKSLNDSLLTCPQGVSGSTSWATSFSYNTGKTSGLYLLIGARGDMQVIETFSDGTGAIKKITSETTASNLWTISVSNGIISGSISTNSAYRLLRLV